MAKLLFSSLSLLVLILTLYAPSPAEAVSCTMCDSCDNPCLPLASPPPPPPSCDACPPPPSSVTYHSPPPPASGGSGGGYTYYYPPPATGSSSGGSYPTPPPPNPIMPYFPFYFYGPRQPANSHSSDGFWIKAFPSICLLFVLWTVL